MLTRPHVPQTTPAYRTGAALLLLAIVGLIAWRVVFLII